MANLHHTEIHIWRHRTKTERTKETWVALGEAARAAIDALAKKMAEKERGAK